jgi:hypothetical protein
VIYDEQPWRDGIKPGDHVVVQSNRTFTRAVVKRLTPKQIIISLPNNLGDMYERAYWKHTGYEVGSTTGWSYHRSMICAPNADMEEHMERQKQERRFRELRDKMQGISPHRFPNAQALREFNDRLAVEIHAFSNAPVQL